MFIHDITGVDSGSGLTSLTIQGSAEQAGRVAVRLQAGSEARTSMADTQPDGGWSIQFDEADCAALPELSCGSEVTVEAVFVSDDEGDQPRPVRWTGRLSCESASGVRRSETTESRGSERVPFEVADVAQPERQRASGGSDAGVSVSPARHEAPRVSSPRSLPRSSPRSSQQQATWPQRREDTPLRRRERAGARRDGYPDVLRMVLDELREQTEALQRLQDDATGRDDATDLGRNTTPRTDDTRSQTEGASDSEQPSLKHTLSTLQASIRDLTQALDASESEDDPNETGESSDDGIRQMLAEIHEHVRAATQREDSDGDADEGSDERSDGDETLRTELRKLRRLVEGLGSDRATTADGARDGEDRERASRELRQLHDRIAPIEESRESRDGDRSRSADRRPPLHDDRRDHRHARRATADRSDRSGAGDRDVPDDIEDWIRHDRWTSSPRPERGASDRSQADRRRSQEEQDRDRPAHRSADVDRVSIRFAPVEAGDWTDEGTRCVTVRARVEHAGRAPVAARLVDERDGTVIADDRGDQGRLALEADVEVEPGETTFTVEVSEPAGHGEVSTTYALSERDEASASLDDRPQADDETDDQADADDGMGGIDYVIASAWALVCAVFLLSVAAGTGGFLQGIITGTFLAAGGTYLTLSPAPRWGLWSLVGIGVAALATVGLLPFTSVLQMDSFLLAGAIAAAGLGVAAVVALFHTRD